MTGYQKVNWRAIVYASLISILIGIGIGFACGIVGLMLFATGAEDVVDTAMSPLGYMIGFLVSLIPVIYGTLFLLNSIEHDKQKHCLLFGAVTVAINIGLSSAVSDMAFTWFDALYFMVIIPTAVITCYVVEGNSGVPQE